MTTDAIAAMHRALSAFPRVVIKALLGAALATQLTAGHAAPEPQVLQLSLFDGKQHTLQATVGGDGRTFLFDTGEGTTMISPEVAARLGCVPWGNEVGFRMLGERFETPRCDDVPFTLSGRRVAARSTLVYDVSKLTGPDAPHLDGAIGLDLFDRQIITLDYGKSTVTVETDGSATARTDRMTEVPLRVTRYANGGVDIFIGVRTERGLAWMTVDSANAGPTVFVAPAMAQAVGLKADVKTPQPVDLQLAGNVRLRTMARVFPDMIMDGNIGMQLLRSHTMTIDLKHDRAWLAPAAASR